MQCRQTPAPRPTSLSCVPAPALLPTDPLPAALLTNPIPVTLPRGSFPAPPQTVGARAWKKGMLGCRCSKNAVVSGGAGDESRLIAPTGALQGKGGLFSALRRDAGRCRGMGSLWGVTGRHHRRGTHRSRCFEGKKERKGTGKGGKQFERAAAHSLSAAAAPPGSQGLGAGAGVNSAVGLPDRSMARPCRPSVPLRLNMRLTA